MPPRWQENVGYGEVFRLIYNSWFCSECSTEHSLQKLVKKRVVLTYVRLSQAKDTFEVILLLVPLKRFGMFYQRRFVI